MRTWRLSVAVCTSTATGKSENLSHWVQTLTEWTNKPYFWLLSVLSRPVSPETFIYWDCHFQIVLQYQLPQCNSLSVRQQFCWATGSLSVFANGHGTKSLCYSPSCLIQCFLLHRPPYQGQASQSHQNTLGPLQRSIQSWLVSCTERLKQKIKSFISYYRTHLITNLHRQNSS